MRALNLILGFVFLSYFSCQESKNAGSKASLSSEDAQLDAEAEAEAQIKASKEKQDRERKEQEDKKNKILPRDQVEIKIRMLHNWYNAFELEDVSIDGVKLGNVKKWTQTQFITIHSQNPEIEFTDSRDGKRISGKLLGDNPEALLENHESYYWRTDTNWIEKVKKKN